MRPRLFTNFQRATHHVFHNLTAIRAHKHTIEKFAEKLGLIYFGAVDQHKDEHRIVRGFTVSQTHADNHYSVGSVDGYDVTVVDRSDAIVKADGSITVHSWLIIAFDLHTEQSLPHIFINAKNHETSVYSSIFASYPMLTPVRFGTFENYDLDFTSRFEFYTSPADLIEVEKLFPADIARVLAAHFWPYSMEIIEGVLYIYSDDRKVTTSTLDIMLENGLWLSKQTDSMMESV
jgi:hypothetical protein